jgi:hypothetical protein
MPSGGQPKELGREDPSNHRAVSPPAKESGKPHKEFGLVNAPCFVDKTKDGPLDLGRGDPLNSSESLGRPLCR